ncbi:MAG: HAMP domain-containing protein [Lachnospira sp.]|nr:HAMP domain-containing protein [Lachnospira sp.]
MGRHSIKVKITLMLTLLISGLLIIVLVLNRTQAERFYLMDKQNQMIDEYDYINSQVSQYSSGALSEEQLEDNIELKTNGTGVSVLVVDSDWSAIYTNINGVADMVERLRLSMFNGAMFDGVAPMPEQPGGNGGFDKLENPSKPADDQSDGAINTEKPTDGDKRPHDKGPVIEFNNISGLDKREIIVEKDNYTLQKIYDARLVGDYYELWGTLDSGDFIMLRMAVQGIRDNVTISNKFIMYIGIFVLVIGMVLSFAFSNYFTKPIKELSNIATKMADMDFNARYEGDDKSEIGVLGSSMNYMSERLEDNISKLKAANIELQRDVERKTQIDEMRSDFISNVSHELKTPIALIQGYAEGLKEGVTDDPESMAYYCDVIIDEAAKMNSMVKKLLTLNQIEFGNEELIMERFDLVSMIKSCIAANELRAGQKGIKISFEYDKEIMDVWSDEYKVEEVFTNYLTNAINHCAGELLIKVRAVYMGDVVRVFVFNTGNHIPNADMEKIWTKFYKVDKARTREYGGNGIGLSIVKAIMDSYGKSYGVENVSDGVRFWFDLDAKA